MRDLSDALTRDPIGQVFGMVQQAWIARLMELGEGYHQKVAMYLGARIDRKTRKTTIALSDDNIRFSIGPADDATWYRALRELADNDLLHREKAHRPGSYIYHIPPLSFSYDSPKGEAKLFRAHTDASWFPAMSPTAIQVLLAHSFFGGARGQAYGHYASVPKIVKLSGLSRRTIQYRTRDLQQIRAFSSEWTTMFHKTPNYLWLFPIAGIKLSVQSENGIKQIELSFLIRQLQEVPTRNFHVRHAFWKPGEWSNLRNLLVARDLLEPTRPMLTLDRTIVAQRK